MPYRSVDEETLKNRIHQLERELFAARSEAAAARAARKPWPLLKEIRLRQMLLFIAILVSGASSWTSCALVSRAERLPDPLPADYGVFHALLAVNALIFFFSLYFFFNTQGKQ